MIHCDLTPIFFAMIVAEGLCACAEVCSQLPSLRSQLPAAPPPALRRGIMTRTQIATATPLLPLALTGALPAGVMIARDECCAPS